MGAKSKMTLIKAASEGLRVDERKASAGEGSAGAANRVARPATKGRRLAAGVGDGESDSVRATHVLGGRWPNQAARAQVAQVRRFRASTVDFRRDSRHRSNQLEGRGETRRASPSPPPLGRFADHGARSGHRCARTPPFALRPFVLSVGVNRKKKKKTKERCIRLPSPGSSHLPYFDTSLLPPSHSTKHNLRSPLLARSPNCPRAPAPATATTSLAPFGNFEMQIVLASRVPSSDVKATKPLGETRRRDATAKIMSRYRLVLGWRGREPWAWPADPSKSPVRCRRSPPSTAVSADRAAVCGHQKHTAIRKHDTTASTNLQVTDVMFVRNLTYSRRASRYKI